MPARRGSCCFLASPDIHPVNRTVIWTSGPISDIVSRGRVMPVIVGGSWTSSSLGPASSGLTLAPTPPPPPAGNPWFFSATCYMFSALSYRLICRMSLVFFPSCPRQASRLSFSTRCLLPGLLQSDPFRITAIKSTQRWQYLLKGNPVSKNIAASSPCYELANCSRRFPVGPPRNLG